MRWSRGRKLVLGVVRRDAIGKAFEAEATSLSAPFWFEELELEAGY
jgi:hypothetical protein